MQKSIYHWLFSICLLFLPIGSDAKIDSQNAVPAPLTNPVFAKDQRRFPTANPLDRLKMPKIVRKFIQKRFYTEGSLKPEPKSKNTLAGRIFTAILLIAAGALLVYWLQGTIGLLIATLGIVSYWRNRDRIADWERRRKERIYNNEIAETERRKSGKSNADATSSLNHTSNRWTRRALTRFLVGIGLTLIGFVFAIISLVANTEAIAIVALIIALSGFFSVFVSIFNALQGIMSNEPQSAWGWVVLLLGIPFVLSLLLLFSFSL
jgi:heme/copper-type cytochrome/quinol oxidase subunit 4